MKCQHSRRAWVMIGCGVAALVVAGLGLWATGWSRPIMAKVFGQRTVDQRAAEFRPARGRLTQHFARAGVAYPPGRLVLLGLKRERRLEVFAARDAGDGLRRVLAYPILAASGQDGPKLREGDRQVPEGVYEIESLNPNSRFHVALRVGYPNAFDREMAARDGRDRLGGDIMIHGGAASVGCLAMGDAAAEELFILAADAGVPNIRLVLAPHDLRDAARPAAPDGPDWMPDLDEQIKTAMAELPEQ